MTHWTAGCRSLPRATRALSLALRLRDRYTRLHSSRVVRLSLGLGRALGLGGTELEMLAVGAAFHDVGKIGIPDDILLHQGELDQDQWQVMRRHPEMSARILASASGDGNSQAVSIVRHHHERMDGGGYPGRLRGEAIPVGSRIVAIADAYDAMAVTRPYRRARSHAEIMCVLDDEGGGMFDAALVRAFASVMAQAPVRLSAA